MFKLRTGQVLISVVAVAAVFFLFVGVFGMVECYFFDLVGAFGQAAAVLKLVVGVGGLGVADVVVLLL